VDRCFEDQIKDCKEVVIDCDCEKVHKFLDEVENCCSKGKILNFNIKMVNTTNLGVYRKTKQVNKELKINDIINGLVQFHQKADKELEEISNICKKG
jgi:phosphatidylinositol kinase/protein kinase (PI-3  family)